MTGEKRASEGFSALERRELVYSGRVQGVGFRYTTHQIAERFDVTGYVQNLPDGSVRLVSEGEAGELNRFLAAVQGELERYIAHIQSRISQATGEFQEFHVRR
jgi:acylphosphatase